MRQPTILLTPSGGPDVRLDWRSDRALYLGCEAGVERWLALSSSQLGAHFVRPQLSELPALAKH